MYEGERVVYELEKLIEGWAFVYTDSKGRYGGIMGGSLLVGKLIPCH